MSKITPKPQEIVSWIYQTHHLERIELSMQDVNQTLQTKTKNPYADGHLKALGYVFNQLIDNFIPLPIQCLTPDKSITYLYFLKEIHKKMMLPLCMHPVFSDDPNIVIPSTVGQFRQSNASNTFCEAPTPNLIVPILHLWLKELADLHDRIGKRTTKPFQITAQEAKQLLDFSHNSVLLFSTVQPFQNANNKLGRIVELLLRAQWRFPHMPLHQKLYDDFIDELQDYQLKVLPQIIKAAKAVQAF